MSIQVIFPTPSFTSLQETLSKIQEISTADISTDVIPLLESADEGTLLIVDVDNTVIFPRAGIFHPHFEATLDELIETQTRDWPKPFQKSMWRFLLMNAPHESMDLGLSQALKEAQNRGATVIFCTKAPTGPIAGKTEDFLLWRIEELKRFHLCWTDRLNANSNRLYLSDDHAKGPQSQGNLLVIGQGAEKGPTVLKWLDQIGLPLTKFHKVISLDDQQPNLHSLRAALKKEHFDQEMIEIHLKTYLEKIPLPPTKEIAEKQLAYCLKTGGWISEEELQIAAQLTPPDPVEPWQIQCVVIDFGGVLMKPDETVVATHLAEYFGVSIDSIVNYDRYYNRSPERRSLQWLGVYDDAIDMWIQVGKDIGKPIINREQFKIWLTEINRRSIKIVPGMIELIDQFYNMKAHIVMLTNCEQWMDPLYTEFIDELEAKTGHTDLFTSIKRSYQTGLEKPSEAAFKSALYAAPKNTLFIDDQIKNIKAAEKLGIRTAYFDTTASGGDGDIQKILDLLKQHGVPFKPIFAKAGERPDNQSV
jgi:FMN phosphatase YigB (HAD superfamily)